MFIVVTEDVITLTYRQEDILEVLLYAFQIISWPLDTLPGDNHILLHLL